MRILATAVTALLVAGLSAAPTAASPPDHDCVGTPWAGNGYYDELPVLTTKDEPLQIMVHPGMFSEHCDGITVHLQKTDGTHKMAVVLDDYTQPEDGWPFYFWATFITIPLYDGAGTWQFTRVTRGDSSLEVDRRFTILRGSRTSLDEPVPVVSPRHTTVTGWAWNYNRVGGLTPSRNRVVEIHGAHRALLTRTRTDSAGRYRALVSVWRRTTLGASSVPIPGYTGAGTPGVTASVRIGMQQVRAPSTVRLGGWWTLTGQAFPGRLATSLDYWNGQAWVWTGSRGDTGTGAWFKRGWKPTRTGTFRLRLTVSANPAVGLLGNPAYRFYTVKVVR